MNCDTTPLNSRPNRNSSNLQHLWQVLGYDFSDDPDFLSVALTHPSAVSPYLRGQATAYERLEFLGDRVLALVIADMLLKRFPAEKEGALAQRHAALVCRETLAKVARQISLGTYLILSRGEEETGGRDNPAILADACEAVMGALFARTDFVTAQDFINRFWTPIMETFEVPPKDAKTSLQEWAQSRGRALPIYEILDVVGPAHDPIFSVVVKVRGEKPVTASGNSKRLAEQAAAQTLLERVKHQNG